MREAFDVCVVGAGPAGVATSIRLAHGDIHVLLLERPANRRRWGGESLAASVRRPLARLALWDEFIAGGHVQGHERRISWGGESYALDSILSPEGGLWHVDRARFDDDLRGAARQRGIEIRTYRALNEVRREGDGWHLILDGREELAAKFLVDATGRARALARKLGVRARACDRLIAMAASAPPHEDPQWRHAMTIQATPTGWWYAAPTPRGHVLVFLTDADLAPRELRPSTQTVLANSAFAEAEDGALWTLVGDAGASHDPLCGWGVCHALESGIQAGDAIVELLRGGNSSLLERYRIDCRSQFQAYLRGLLDQYARERRWPSSAFWSRRAQPTPVADRIALP